MSQDRNKGRGGKAKNNNPAATKVSKRDYALVSPNTPEETLTLNSIRAMVLQLLSESLEPITAHLERLERAVEINSDKLQEKFKFLEKDNIDLKDKFIKSEKKTQELQDKVTALETASRRNNLKFLYVKCDAENGNSGDSVEDCESLILKLCAKLKLAIQASDIERAHRTGYSRNMPRPIIVKFQNFKIRQKIIKAKQSFREVGITVVEDFPIEVSKRRKVFSPVLQAAYKSGGKYKAHLNIDKLILNGKAYTTKDLQKLPDDLQPGVLCNVSRGNKLAFFTKHSKMSNHYPCQFRIDGFVFATVEQFFMYKKAKHFQDEIAASAILNTEYPEDAKSLGRKIENFKPNEWREACNNYMSQGLQAKFNQNEHLASFLKSTGTHMLIEANPTDLYWGVGFSLQDEELWEPDKWKGRNELGKLLMDIRSQI